jgi:hypothetical protein
LTDPSSLAILATSPQTIDDVLERMAAIEGALPPTDGVAYFNRMYRKVTEEVHTAVLGRRFEADPFLERLDVVFANLYFSAVGQWVRGEEVARAWKPLFEQRTRADRYPIQFALAGMNAHINHDLPVAVVQTCTEMSLLPEDASPPYHDFDATNDILESVEGNIKAWFEGGLMATADVAMGKIDDALETFSISTARRIAWENAQLLWSLRDHPRLQEMFERSLARMTKLAGSALLF